MLTAAIVAAPTIQAKVSSDTTKLEEVVLTLPFEELIISPEGILVNYEGDLLAVHALVRHGEQWRVRAGGSRYFRCLNGHWRACPICGGCAVSDCDYYCDGYCCTYGH